MCRTVEHSHHTPKHHAYNILCANLQIWHIVIITCFLNFRKRFRKFAPPRCVKHWWCVKQEIGKGRTHLCIYLLFCNDVCIHHYSQTPYGHTMSPNTQTIGQCYHFIVCSEIVVLYIHGHTISSVTQGLLG